MIVADPHRLVYLQGGHTTGLYGIALVPIVVLVCRNQDSFTFPVPIKHHGNIKSATIMGLGFSG